MSSQMNASRSWMRRGAGAAALAAVCASGLNGTGAAQAQNAPGRFERALPVAVIMATDKKTYAAGEPINITMTVRNTSRLTVQLPFSNGQRYDFKLYDARTGGAVKPDESKLVWQWGRGRMFTMMISSEKLDAGKTLVFSDKYESAAAPSQVAKPVAGSAVKPAPGQTPKAAPAPPVVKPVPGQAVSPLAAGRYILVGTLTTLGGAPQPSATTTIEIK